VLTQVFCLAKTSLMLGPLGGGGARGLAHIGVLKVLEKNHPPDLLRRGHEHGRTR